MKIDIGDLVMIKRKDIKGLGRTKYGVVRAIDGEYVMVKPNGKEWLVELFRNEVDVCRPLQAR